MGSLRYFDTLPTVVYTKNGNSILYTNLLARASVRPAILQNSSIYYEYDIQESDTPEIIAAKYYDDPFEGFVYVYRNKQIMADNGKYIEYDNRANQYSMFLFD